ncbi:methyl-accepting chemotaxis protein, partial [Aestuariispira insulae]|uniref:methyl-accepting chemotaxis protein n=1 Tax=Aestuariispira insulae TaxID=1461337 RepID=UPI001FE66FEF
CQANVMLADPDLNIVYMNNTMVAMMKNAEADLKKDLPNLDTESLLGTCVDVFHKNPAHQRGMIEGLTSAYETSINVGGRTFELIASPVKDSRGERIGTVVEWDDVTEKLARETAAKRTADENQRIRIALDNCQANVMLADPDLNIVYMNNTMVAMMKNAEADLKKDLPNLDTSKLIGTCVDVFHKNPSHQRGMIEALSSAYETTIEVGGRTFDLIASPVVDENGNRLGTVVEWADVTEKLATEREATRVANENMRVRVALDNCAANVMVADNSYDIIYMNQAVLKMMKNAEADLKKDLPSFDANNLIGNSIDNFHKNPAHQRGMLEKLDSIYETSIKVGGRTFDLIANPIVSEAGERLGTVVEWNDVTQELAIQEEVDEVVQAVVSGDFTKSLALEGKDGFMLSLSQAINGLKDNIENVLNDVAEALASLARGDLTNQITADYQGTYETLKQDVNQTTERLAKTVSDIITAANEISNASSEIAAGGTDLSQRTEQQASNLEETAASMEEMATTVKQNAENAQQANQLSITARQTAEGGGDVVSKAVTAMAGIEESSQKVSDIIGVIDEIAFQTNLLALNAAVEAARAGEAGKGFAVVASEVRTLAQRSSEAAKDIKGLILDSDAQVKDGVQLVNQTGESLSEIVDSIKRVADIVSEIAAASGEQATGVEEINTAITNMDEMTQQNAALVEESSANARSLEEQSEHMLEMMGFFNIDGAQTEPAERIPANNGVHNGAKPAAKKAKAENRAPEKSGKPAKPKKAAAASAAPVDDDWEEF